VAINGASQTSWSTVTVNSQKMVSCERGQSVSLGYEGRQLAGCRLPAPDCGSRLLGTTLPLKSNNVQTGNIAKKARVL
jgi:hypothetical protein